MKKSKQIKILLTFSAPFVALSSLTGMVGITTQTKTTLKTQYKAQTAQDDVQIICTTTGDHPENWHTPNLFDYQVHDRFYRMYFSNATSKELLKSFYKRGPSGGVLNGINYIMPVDWFSRAPGSYSHLLHAMMWGMSENADGRPPQNMYDDRADFLEMVNDPNGYGYYYTGKPDTGKGSEDISFHQFNDLEWYQTLQRAVDNNLGSGMYLYCNYQFIIPNKYGVAYGTF